MSDPSSDVNPLDALAEEFVARHRAGERPSLDEFIARRPDLADDIRDLFPGLVLMEGVRPAPGDVTGPFEGGGAVAALKRLGDYRILREVGRGGMGVVYEAEQESLGRHVALKVLPAHSLLEPQRLRRFQREAKAAARLHHTNIVPVYGVGEQDGLHYYVMQFIQGLGLDQVLAELRKLRPAPAVEDAPPSVHGTASAASAAHSLLTGRFETAPPDAGSPPDSGGSSALRLPGQADGAPPSRTGREYWRSVARVGVQVGDALAYAHGQGVLHRDVKPSNLLLDARGNVWVTDFGLAKAADGEDLTHTGDIVGTLRYMAPECFSGRGDARADVYSLGLTLYELLTLRPAFAGKDRNQLLAQAMQGEPPRPRSLDRDLPRDLETVVLKAIARDPAHRYATAAELASDLRRFVDDRPVRARRVGWAELAWRWGRRNPVVTGLAAAVLLLLIVGTAGSAVVAYYFSRLADAQGKLRADADNAKSQVQKQADELREGIERMNRANELMESGRLHADAGENNLALADYSAAVEQRPDMSAAWLARGQLYMRFYCLDDAAADCERGFALHPPTDPSLWLSQAYLRVYVGDADGYRGTCAAMLDKFGQTTDPATAMDIAQACTAGPNALPDYTPVIRLMDVIKADPSNPYLVEQHDVRLALLYCRAGKVDQAIGMVEDKSHDWNDPGFVAAYHRAGQEEKTRKLMAEFTQKSLDALLDHPSVPSDAIGDGMTLPLDIGEYLRYRETLQLLDGAAAVEHPVELLHSEMGHAALGQWDKAAAELDRAVSLRQDHAGLRLQRGRVLAHLERWDEAAADYAEAVGKTPEDQRAGIYDEIAAADASLSTAVIALRPDEPWLLAARARQHVAAEPPAWVEAEADYAKAIELLPKEAAFRYDRGRMHAKEGKWDRVAADFDAALKLKEPEGEPGWVEILMMLAAAGDREVFRRAADRMLALYGDSQNPVELQQTAECCMMLPNACSDPQSCLRAAKKAYAADQGVWNTTTLALAEYRNGQFEPAASFLNSYLDNLPDGTSEQDRLILQLLLGMSERKAGRDKEARTELQPALQRLNEIVPATDAAGIRTYDPWQALRSEATALFKEAAPKPEK